MVRNSGKGRRQLGISLRKSIQGSRHERLSFRRLAACKSRSDADPMLGDLRPIQDERPPKPRTSPKGVPHIETAATPEHEICTSPSRESDDKTEESSVIYKEWVSERRHDPHIFTGRGIDSNEISPTTTGNGQIPSVLSTDSIDESMSGETLGLLKNDFNKSKQRETSFKIKLKKQHNGKKNSKETSTSFLALPNKLEAHDVSEGWLSAKSRSAAPTHAGESDDTSEVSDTGGTAGGTTKRRLSGRRSSFKRLLNRSSSVPIELSDVSKTTNETNVNATRSLSLTFPKKTDEPALLQEDEDVFRMESRTTYDFDELIPYSKGACAKSKLIRFGVSEKTLRLRKKIDALFRQLGVDVNKELCLNPKGICYFGHDKFVVVVEVPNNSDCVFIYSMLHRLTARDNVLGLMYKALRLNYLQQETRGACLSMDDDEFTLSFIAPIDAMDLKEFRNILGNFIGLVVDLERKLMEANGAQGEEESDETTFVEKKEEIVSKSSKEDDGETTRVA